MIVVFIQTMRHEQGKACGRKTGGTTKCCHKPSVGSLLAYSESLPSLSSGGMSKLSTVQSATAARWVSEGVKE